MNDSEIFPVPLFHKMHYNAKKARRQDNHNRKMNEPCDPSCTAAIQFMAMAGVEQQSSNAIIPDICHFFYTGKFFGE